MHRTFAAVAAILGVSTKRVADLVDYGPLIARRFDDGRRLIHDEDLALFRRPLGLAIATTGNNLPPHGGEMLRRQKSTEPNGEAAYGVNASLIMRLCGEERWAPVPGSDRHEVSTLGRLRSWRIGKRVARLATPIEVTPRTLGEGYLGFGKQTALHVAVLEAFVGPRPEGKEAAHKNGIKSDCRLENLRWATHAENIADKVRHGTLSARRKPNLKLVDVEEIRRRRGAGESRESVAADFGVTPQTISNRSRLTLVTP